MLCFKFWVLLYLLFSVVSRVGLTYLLKYVLYFKKYLILYGIIVWYFFVIEHQTFLLLLIFKIGLPTLFGTIKPVSL